MVLMLFLIYGWRKIPEFQLKPTEATIKFSIIVPFRNEAGNLPDLLNSIKHLDYPFSYYELILIDDDSEDGSHRICSEFLEENSAMNASIIKNNRSSNSPKKDAILSAIKKARFKYIITTDADCKVPEKWLQAHNAIITKTGAKLVAGPVNLTRDPKKGIKTPNFKIFEMLDMLSLQAAGAGGFGINRAFMCNGANLCYKKSTFLKVGGFTGNEKIASGDDVFLLQKFQEKKQKIVFLKSREAIVTTRPQESLSTLISQRIRWAAKAPAYKSLFAKCTGATILFMNLILVAGAFLVLFQVMPYQPFLILFLLKFNIDFILLYHSAQFFKREAVLRSYFWSSVVYPFFSTYIAVKSLFSGFEWKGRNFSK